ncbi:ABC transporter substrate-binding protein [Helicobacter sp. 16-1353]|uniref:transporter substrate-binding domain-containing protein n=1 Tax=Helicobacter sp. 16-1353 TaxID=2004996 RepID=UPI000DCBAD47|nr:transporter substrate-binding domain-containing protein [Helicobacter sp. 16-1353]RAX54256.1 ABC transporter substrate-binding protein [Helicobacter sp. 16-1353]
MKKFFSILTMIFIGVFFVACGENTQAESTQKTDDSLSKIIERDKVIIGVFGDKPPFGYVDSNGVNQGFDIYIAKQVAKELLGDENKLEFVLVEAQNRVEFLKSNKVDIIFANFTKTKEREEVVDFALPYMKVALGVVSKNGDIKNVDELKDKTLIVNKGTTADFYFSEHYPDMNILKFDQNTEAFLALKDNRGEALAHDNLLLFAWANANPPYEVGITHLGNDDVIAPAVKKGNTELLNKLNEILVKLGKENFIHKAYDATLSEVYGTNITADSVVIENTSL